MAKRLERNLPFLQMVKNAKPQQRQQLLHHATSDQITCLSDCCFNVLKGNVELTPEQQQEIEESSSIYSTCGKKRR